MVLMKHIRANRAVPLFMLMWQSIFFVVGVAMVLIINTFVNEDPDFACIGTLMALVATLVGVIARGNLNGHVRFRLAVSMGETRISYLLCTPVVTAGVTLIGVLTAWLMYLAEKALYTAIYPNFENDIPMEEVFSWVVILCIVAGAVLLELVMSALMQRFGSKGFLVIWLGCCGLFMILPRMIDAYQSGSNSVLAKIGGSILTAITTIPVKGWIAIGVVFVLALLVFVVDTFRKAEVKM
ncbi:MAG: hypothetical protein IKC03_08430 [Oscillospiraceae bacterium]|nr:hypothetical protein [Oscillospiraceae bacterium]